jgi:C4-dicarboxylate transporter DctM subunit
MDPFLIGVVGIIILIFLLFSKLPIGAGMAIVGFFGFAAVVGLDPALGLLQTVPYTTFSEQGLSVIPLFCSWVRLPSNRA